MGRPGQLTFYFEAPARRVRWHGGYAIGAIERIGQDSKRMIQSFETTSMDRVGGCRMILYMNIYSYINRQAYDIR